MGAMQYLRDPRKLKIGMFFVMILVIPSFVLFYGFSGEPIGGSGVGMVDRPVATVKTSGGDRHVMGSQMRNFRENLAMRYVGLYQSEMQQQPDQATFARISAGITNKEIAEYAAGLLAVEDVADRYRVVVTAQQVADDLRAQGITSDVLQQVLRQRRQREADFLAEQSRSLRSQRASEILTSAARVSLPELWQEYSMNNSRVAVEYVNFDVFEIERGMEAEEEEVREWFEENSERYIQSEQRIYRTVSMAAPTPDIPIEPSEQEIEDRYEAIDHLQDERFANPDGIEVRQIVISTRERDEDAALQTAEELLGRLAEGEDFAELADQYSDDIQNIRFDEEEAPSLRGGLLPENLTSRNMSGWSEEYGRQWADFVQSAQPDDELRVVEVNEGFAIVRVEAIHEGGKRAFADVREIIRNEIMSERRTQRREIQLELVNELEPRMREAVAQSSSLSAIAQALDLEVVESEPIAAQNYSIPGIGSLFAHRELIARLEPGDISPVMRTGANPPTLVVLQVSEVLPERPQTFEEAKTRARRDLLAHRTQEKVQEMIDQLKAEVEQGTPLQEAAESLGVGTYEIVEEPFLLSEPPGRFVSFPDAQRDFSSRAVRSQPGDVFSVHNTMPGSDRFFSAAVIRLIDRQEPDRSEFIDEVSRFEAGLMSIKREMVLNAYKKEALERLGVSYDEDYVSEVDPRERRRGRS